MKDFILYKFNIKVDKIYKENDLFYFFTKDNDKIYIYKTKDNLEQIIKLSNEIFQNGLNINTFLYSINKNFYEKYNDYNIYLIKVNEIEEFNINFFDIKKFNDICINILSKNEIFSNKINEFEKEIDDVEVKLSEFNNEYPLIKNSFNYYIGLAENALSLIKNANIKYDSIGIKLNNENLTLKKLYNPIYYKFENKFYNYSIYIKEQFFNLNLNYDEVKFTFDECIDEDEMIILYSYLLYPNYYFEKVLNIINDNCNEKELNKYLNMVNQYQEFLNYCKKFVKNEKNILLISWL